VLRPSQLLAVGAELAGTLRVPRSAKYAGLPPLDHPARAHSPDEIRRLAVRAASPRRRSSSGNSLCGENSLDPGNLRGLSKGTGKYRVGFDQMIFDSNGVSTMSMEDYAVALVDELERGAHLKMRITVSY
jgi:hypothetical protein